MSAEKEAHHDNQITSVAIVYYFHELTDSPISPMFTLINIKQRRKGSPPVP